MLWTTDRATTVTTPTAPATTPGELIRLSPVEIAAGVPLGEIPWNGPTSTAGAGEPRARAVLESVVGSALRQGPTVVSFSGGRDSSAVLAVATHVARRDGLPLPVPVTLSFPGLEGADESEWQRLVLEHLRLPGRRVVRVHAQERLLGDLARASLGRHGLVWPANAHADVLRESLDRGTQLLTGEGGDEVLGTRRLTPWTVARAARRPRNVQHLRELWGTVAGPALPLGRLAGRNPWIDVVPWARGEARQALRADLARQARSPWRYDRATAHLMRRRVPAVLAHNLQVLAAERDLRLHHPLQHPDFVTALAQDGGSWGFRGRTDTMRFLFADLLPDALLARRSKASFNGSRFGEDERDFVTGWDGTGIDDRLVDIDTLRRNWLSARPAGVTGPLLHQAWLAQAGAR